MWFKKNWLDWLFFLAFFIFSWWLMWHTFGYKDGIIYIAPKVWSDFAANIPLIRSFSWGKNWPPEYPLFPGEPIKYHFLFYLLVGMLERIGLPINWALNLPSVLGFWGLMMMIYLLTKLLFKKRSVALLAVIFFLFNGSFSFLEFFRQQPLSWRTLSEIITNNNFSSFGPYDGKIVAVFWNLNIYTNQRHLAASYFLVLLVIYILVKAARFKKKLKLNQIVFIGILVGLLPFFHKVGFIIAGLSLVSFFVYLPKQRSQVLLTGLIALILALPQLAYQFDSGLPSIFIHKGYLIAYPLTIRKFVNYWFLNLGLSLILVPVGFIFSNRLAKKVFLAVLPLFIIGNTFQFSPEIAANHKFFNFFLIIGNMLTSGLIYLIWCKKIIGKIIAFILVFFLIFSGIIDFFPVRNDKLGTLLDAPKNPDILWIKNNTPSDAVFLNSSFLYHPASLAGRKIFLGWPYFSWSAGYDINQRSEMQKRIFNSTSLPDLCFLLKENKISYIANQQDTDPDLKINSSFVKQKLKPVYNNPSSDLKIYSTNLSCSHY